MNETKGSLKKRALRIPRKCLAKEVRRLYPGMWKNTVQGWQRVRKGEERTGEGTNLITIQEDHSNGLTMKAAEGRFWRKKDNKLCELQCCRSEMMSSWHDGWKNCTSWDYSWCHKERGGKFCLHELCVQGSSEASKRTHQGKMAGKKSKMGVTLEIIHGLVTIEGR